MSTPVPKTFSATDVPHPHQLGPDARLCRGAPTDEFLRCASLHRWKDPTNDDGMVMTEIAERYRKVAGEFTKRVESVPDGAWENPAPCEGWVARDIVGHLVEWLPAFFYGTWDIESPPMPSVDEDPAGAWEVVNATLQAALDDPNVAGSERDTRMGRSTFEATLDMICTGDVLIHTWDLSRATGLDETLDPDEVHKMALGMEGLGDMLEQSGQYGPRVAVPDDVDEQTKLLAFVGRRA
jgi:uncharacterized protein (TIGR03086 family)